MIWNIILRIGLLLFISMQLFAQPKNALTGEYAGHEKYAHHNFVFMGNGKVFINREIQAEFYYENDSLFIFKDMDISIYKMEKNKLIGLTPWEKNQTLKLKKNTVDVINPIEMVHPRADWLKRFYKNNAQSRLSEMMDNGELALHFKAINEENERLCFEGFDLGCIQNYSFLTLQLMNEQETVDTHKSEFLQLKHLAERVIQLGNPDGYGLLYSYFVMKDEESLGEEYLELGLALGSQLCIKLSLDKMKIDP